MLLGLATLVCLLTVPFFGGRLSALADLELRGGRLLLGALALQVLVIEVVPDAPAPLPALGHVASYGLAAAAVYLNRRVPFLWLIALGGALNAAVIVANHGVMPARAGALATAGLSADTGTFANSTTVAHAHLAWLGDVFAVPDGFPAANVFSVGDVVIVLGLLAGLHVVCRSRPVRLRAQRAEASL